MEERTAPAVSSTITGRTNFIISGVIGGDHRIALYAGLLIGCGLKALRANTGDGGITVLLRKWVLTVITDGLITLPTQWVITSFTVGPINTLISTRAVYTITGIRIAKFLTAANHAYARILGTVLYRERVFRYEADWRITCPTLRFFTGFTVAAVHTLKSVRTVYGFTTVLLG